MESGAVVRARGTHQASEPGDPIDRAYLSRYTLGDGALETEVLGLFCGQSFVYLDRLRDAASLAEWRDAAHSLKGSAQAVGAVFVAEAARRAEAFRALPSDGARKASIAELAAALSEAKTYIGTLAEAS